MRKDIPTYLTFFISLELPDYTGCFHGGASWEKSRFDFAARDKLVIADVLDSPFSPCPEALRILESQMLRCCQESPPTGLIFHRDHTSTQTQKPLSDPSELSKKSASKVGSGGSLQQSDNFQYVSREEKPACLEEAVMVNRPGIWRHLMDREDGKAISQKALLTSILCSSGSSSLMFSCLPNLLDAGSRVLILSPMYGEYKHILQEVACVAFVTQFPLLPEDDFAINEEQFIAEARRYIISF